MEAKPPVRHDQALPPYKLLLEFLPHLRKRLVDVKAELAETHQPENSSENIEPDIERPAGEEEDAVSAKPHFTMRFDDDEERRRRDGLAMRISHLECLVGFIDSNLGDLIKTRAQIAEGTLERIAFDDLWHLFRPGARRSRRLQNTGQGTLAAVQGVLCDGGPG